MSSSFSYPNFCFSINYRKANRKCAFSFVATTPLFKITFSHWRINWEEEHSSSFVYCWALSEEEFRCFFSSSRIDEMRKLNAIRVLVMSVRLLSNRLIIEKIVYLNNSHWGKWNLRFDNWTSSQSVNFL
jgi:hypothetical protein